MEKSGAKGANACTILGGRVRTISITSFWLIAVTSVPYPFRSQMAKVERLELLGKTRRSASGELVDHAGEVLADPLRDGAKLLVADHR